MPLSFWKGSRCRRASIGAVALLLAVFTSSSVVRAQSKSPYSFSAGVDFTSHFISYGADVWGGGDEVSPFGGDATMFVYGTMTLAFTDQLSGFVNVWSDVNNNAESSIGGDVQEIDLNVGGTFAIEKFGITLAHGCWMYAGDVEHVIDLTVAYGDADMITKGFALNPSVNVHWRYEGNGGVDQEEGVALVFGLKPSYTFMGDSKFPLTFSVPMSAAFFLTDDFQGPGADTGFAYASAGVGVSVPLSFIPPKFGAWNVSGSIIYYCTESDMLPNNPEANFWVSSLSIGMAI
jgi:hypothetical protein